MHRKVYSFEERQKIKTNNRNAVMVVATIFAIIVVQLLLSILVSSGAYEIASLKANLNELSRDYSKAKQYVGVVSSPQSLAEKAEKLGMVSNVAPVYLRLSDGAVLGQPSPALASDGIIAGSESIVSNSLLTPEMSVLNHTLVEHKADKNVSPVQDIKQDGPVVLANGLPAVSTR